MSTIIFLAVGAEPLDRIELKEAAVVADLVRALEGRGVAVAELIFFHEDRDEPLQHHHPLHGHDHPVFHAHRCRKIDVTVHYKADALTHRFAPSATIASVTRWAVERAGLGKQEAQEHVLQISGSRVQPPAGAHLGSFAAHVCAAAFDLVRKKLVQG